MPQRCSVCSHPKRDQVNQRLLEQVNNHETLASIGTAFGLTSSALDRHKVKHLKLSTSLVQDQHNALAVVGFASDLYERSKALLARAEALLDQPTGSGPGADQASRRVQAAAAALRELRQSIELLARLVVTAPPELPAVEASWLDEAITRAVESMQPAALPSGAPALEPDVVDAVIVQAPD